MVPHQNEDASAIRCYIVASFRKFELSTVTALATSRQGALIFLVQVWVPSKLFFATDRDMWLIKKLKNEEEKVYNNFSLEHYFEQFAFGDQS